MLEKINVSTALAAVKAYLQDLQNRICFALEAEDGQASFIEDIWQHGEGGGGRTRFLENGAVIEKAGVNFSHVAGQRLPPAATAKRPDLIERQFQAMGVSVVVHPRNPFAPTSHLNVRFIVAEKTDADPVWWFGGGFDMTPYYGFKEDCEHWHQQAKAACEVGGAGAYLQYKAACDKYFYLKHRDEPRGIGGIFFDDLNQDGFANSFRFMRSVGDHYIKAYQPILHKRKAHDYTQHHREFQCYRRGRYVEFNLLYDRGTLFGLQSGGRTESILMSLPPNVIWKYNWQPIIGSAEAELYSTFLQIRNWV